MEDIKPNVPQIILVFPRNGLACHMPHIVRLGVNAQIVMKNFIWRVMGRIIAQFAMISNAPNKDAQIDKPKEP